MEKNRIAYIDEENTGVMVDGYIKKNYSTNCKTSHENSEEKWLEKSEN